VIFSLFGGSKKRIAEMIDAARTGDTDKVKQLLAKGADINAPAPESGDTPLLAAIDKSQWSTAEYLLTQRPDLRLEDKNGNSPLYLAVSRGDSALALVNLLLAAGAPVDLGPKHGDNAGATALHIACATGANGCVASLLHHGASAAKPTPSGATPLHAAAIGGDQQTIDLLCNAGGSVTALNADKRTPLHNCGITGNARAAAALIRHGAPVDDADAEDCTPLMRAAMANHAEVATLLLDHGADPNVIVRTGSTPTNPLFVAATHGHDEVVRILLAKGANVTAKGDGVPSPAEAAKRNGHAAAAKLISAAIKKKKAEENEASTAAKEAQDLWQRIVLSAAQRDQERLRALVSDKAFASLSVDARLIAACALGDAEIARDMLQAGADPNKPCNDGFDGFTPLVMTVGISRSVEVATLLIDAGADVNDEWSETATPIFETTNDQFYDLAKLLISRGANVNVRLGDGLTPLMSAARNGASRCVDLFLDAGADINAVENKQGVGAFGLALNRLDLSLAEHLLARGAEPNFGSIDTLALAIAEHGKLAFVEAVEARGCQLVRADQRGRMAFVSARNPDPEVFDYLLNHGADPSEGNDFGYTPLTLAALNNHHHLIRRYLARGDDASVRDVDGETALSLAIEKQHQNAVAALREFHVEEGDYAALEPEVAMLKAAEDGALGTILNLREAGVSINSCDGGGNSAIMVAARAGHQGVVRSLYHLGADINRRNHAGETALAIAKASDATDIVNSLQEFGALDAIDGELGEVFAKLGGVHVWNAGDMMFGRLSHPYKKQPPYEEPESESDDATADEDNSASDEDEDGTSDSIVSSASIDTKLALLGEVLDSDQVKEQLPEGILEHLAQKLDHWRSLHEESELDDDNVAELDRLLGQFGLGEEEEEEEVERTPLFEAVHAQDLATVRKLIKGGADVNDIDGDGNTPLLVAVLTRQTKLVDELLKLGADPNKARPDGKGPLFGAVRVGEEKIAQTLLKAGAEVDAPMSVDHNGIAVGGCTALYVAALQGQLPACKVLVSGGAKVDASSDLGYTALMVAIDAGQEDVIDFLLRSGANVNPDVTPRVEDVGGLGGSTPLYSAIRKEDISVIKKLLKRGADINRASAHGWTPLKSAAQQGNFEIVKLLLEAGADPNIADNTNYTPLMNAVSGQHENIVKILLKFKADPNVQSGENPQDDDWEPGRSALMDAAVSGNVAIARELLKGAADPNLVNSNGRTALHSAVISANADMVALLLKSGANPDVFGNDEKKMSALDLALVRWASEEADSRESGISDVLELMLKKALPKDRSSLTETTLSLLTNGHEEAIELLQSRKISIDVDEQSMGATRLFMQAGLGDLGLDAAKALLKYGANPSFKSKAGLPVISMAVRQGGNRLVEALLDAGADVMARNSVGVLAYDLAAIYGRHEAALRLIDAMNRKALEINVQDSDGQTALMRAVKSADLMAVKQLLSAGAATDRRDLQGETPLSYAVTHDLFQIALALRAAGAETISSLSGTTSLVDASRLGALGTVLDLLDAGRAIEEVDDHGETALTAAAIHPGILKVLAKYGANLAHKNKSGNTAYMIASASDRSLMMSVLADLGASLESPAETDGSTMKNILRRSIENQMGRLEDQLSDKPEILGAAEKEALELALVDTRLAISKGYISTDDSAESDAVSESESVDEELLLASLIADTAAVSSQIAAGVDVNYQNDEGRTALMMALARLGGGEMSRRKERNFEQVIDTLLLAGADPNTGAMSPLIIATMTGRLHLVNAMLRAGADVDATTELPTDEDGGGAMRATALFVALSPNEHDATMNERIGLSLLEAGPDLSFSSDDGSMAVHCAARSGLSKALSKILDLAPEGIDAQDEDGSTPLMLAAAQGHVDAIKALLQRGARRDIQDETGRTASQIAQEAGHQHALAALA
jgi:ankyrin repeat protein